MSDRSMSDIDTAALRGAALAATPGPWGHRHDEYGDEWWFGGMSDGGQDVIFSDRSRPGWMVTDSAHGADAAYIAAVNPEVVLSLLDELDFLRVEDERAHQIWIKYSRALDLLGGGTYCSEHGDIRTDGCIQCHDATTVDLYSRDVLDGMENGYQVNQMDDRTLALLGYDKRGTALTPTDTAPTAQAGAEGRGEGL